MESILTDKPRQRSLLGGGWSMVTDNKRYIVWFFLLNLALAICATVVYWIQVDSVLDHSLIGDRLVNGLDLSVYLEMSSRPEFGPTSASNSSAFGFAIVFFLFTALFMPGVLQGYASTYRLPREDFFRACGRNLWRFMRLMIVAGIVMGIFTGVLFGIRAALVNAAGKNTYELLPFDTSMACLLIIFLAMSALRIWFDLAEADIVLSDQRAVRRSIGKAFRYTWRHLGRLLGSYVITTVVALIVLAAGLWVWVKYVPPANVAGAFFVSQLTLLLLLIPRFWQRGVAVTYYKQHMIEPIAEQSFAPASIVAPVKPVDQPAAEPVATPSESQAS